MIVVEFYFLMEEIGLRKAEVKTVFKTDVKGAKEKTDKRKKEALSEK